MTIASKLSVTFTGADNRTLVDDLTIIIDASRTLRVPVEFGLLCSTTRAGEERYPGGFAARHLQQVCRTEGVPVAVHLCGAAAKALLPDRVDWLERDAFGSPEWRQVVLDVFARGRVQINLPRDLSTVANLREAWHRLRALSRGAHGNNVGVVIGQHRVGEWPVPDRSVEARRSLPDPIVSWLLDRSGGRGTPVSLGDVSALPDFPIGIAGGLGPDDPELLRGVVSQLLRSTHGGWVDMESQIRTDGKLDPAKCVDVLLQVARVRDELRFDTGRVM